MIAEVYPLLRLPRGKKHFDYLAPDGMMLKRGSFVRVPYRQQILWGIVRQVKDKPPRGITLRSIQSVHPSAALREEELSFFEWLARDLAQSVSSVLYAALPRPPSREGIHVRPAFSWLPLTLPRAEAEHVARIVRTLTARGKAFVQTPDIRRAAAVVLGYLQMHPEQKLLILAPTVRDVELIRSRLTGVEPLVITGKERNNERFATWQTFRAQANGVLLGTRTALLAIDASVTSIFVLRAGDAGHKAADRNPRYDARRLVWQHHERFASNLFCLDVAPQSDTVHRFDELERVSWGVYPDAHTVSAAQEKTASAMQSVGYTAVQAIATCLAQNKRAVCVYNRKGAGELRCADCLHRFACPDCRSPLGAFSHTMECARCRHKEPLVLRCPDCRFPADRST
jgi:primosomal protein N'